jgi:hypothetical protein
MIHSGLHRRASARLVAVLLVAFLLVALASLSLPQAAWASSPERLFAGWNNGSLGLVLGDGAISTMIPEWQSFGLASTFSPDGRTIYYDQMVNDPAGANWQLLGRDLRSGATTVVCDSSTAPMLFGTRYVGFSGLSNPVTGELYFFGRDDYSSAGFLFGLDPATGVVRTRGGGTDELNGDSLRVSPDGAYLAWTADSTMPPETDYPKFLICLVPLGGDHESRQVIFRMRYEAGDMPSIIGWWDASTLIVKVVGEVRAYRGPSWAEVPVPAGVPEATKFVRSPDGASLAYSREDGTLWLAHGDGTDAHKVCTRLLWDYWSWNASGLPAGGSGTGDRFSDLALYPYARAVSLLADRGVVLGYPDGTYRPTLPVTRAQFAKMLVLTLGIPVTEGVLSSPFTDVEKVPGSLFPYDYVAAAAHAGIVRGVEAARFDPYAPVTRAQAMTMMVRALQALSPDRILTPSHGWKATAVLAPGDPTHGENAALAQLNGLLAGVDLGGWDVYLPASRGLLAQLLSNIERPSLPTPQFDWPARGETASDVLSSLETIMGSSHPPLYLPTDLPPGFYAPATTAGTVAGGPLANPWWFPSNIANGLGYGVAFTNDATTIRLWVDPAQDGGEPGRGWVPTDIPFGNRHFQRSDSYRMLRVELLDGTVVLLAADNGAAGMEPLLALARALVRVG